MKLKYAYLAIALIIAIFLVASCSKQTPGTKLDAKEQLKLSAVDIESVKDPELKALVTARQVPEPKDTSFDIIDKKLEEGKLSEKDANTLRIIANFKPEALPEGYKEQPLGRNSYQEADIWLAKNWDSLDENTKKLLEPYYYERNDPRNHMNAPTDAQKLAEALSVIPSVKADDELVMELVTTITDEPERKAKIYHAVGDVSQTQQADWASNSFVKSYQMFEQLLGKRPDKAVYVYFENMNSYGSAVMKEIDGENRCRIRLRIGMNHKMVESTLSHELFHCFQFAIPLDYDPEDEKWLMESTATWSEHFVYPDYNSEHEYLPRFFKKLNKYMMRYGLNHEYATYMWHLFVTEYTSDPTYVKDVLLKAKTGTSKDAVSKDPMFNNRFAEYAVWNWNSDPFIRYADVPSIPGNPVGGESYSQSSYPKDQQSTEFEVVNPLGVKYQLHTFTEDTDKVTYTFENEGNEKNRRAALIKFGDQWYREDWTNLKEKTFCRAPDGRMAKGVILVSSNSDTENSWSYSYDIDTNGKCNPQWHGTVRVIWDFTNSDELGFAHITNIQQSTMESTDVLVYDRENDEFLVKDQQINYRYMEKQISKYPDKCGAQDTVLTNLLEGNAHESWEIDGNSPSDSSAPERLAGTGEEGEYKLYLEINPGSNWLSATDTRAKTYKPCGFEGAFTPTVQGNQNEVYTTKISRMKYMVNPIIVKMSEDKKSFRATETVNIPWGTKHIQAKVIVDYWFG